MLNYISKKVMNRMYMMKNKQKMMDIFTFIIGLLLYIEIIKLTKYAQFDVLGPIYLPKIITIFIMILSVISFFTPRKENNKDEVAYNYKKIILFVFITIIYLLALSHDLGFFVCSTIYFLIFILMFDNYKLNNLHIYLVISLVVSYSIYYFFEKIMRYPLP